jgi:DNA-binding transcriptional ArsR family regulator
MDPTDEDRDLTEAQLTAAAATFSMLSSCSRLHLVWLLAADEYDVSTLAELTGINVAAASQHLAKLRRAGVVTTRRHGRRQVYRVEDRHIVTVVSQVVDSVSLDQPANAACSMHMTRGASGAASVDAWRVEAR